MTDFTTDDEQVFDVIEVELTPEEAGVLDAVTRHNCKLTLEMNRERVFHFERRIAELGRTIEDTVIVVLNVDDELGAVMTEILMPGSGPEWQAYRDKGMVPIARGLAGKAGLRAGMEVTAPRAGKQLDAITDRAAVVVVDYGVMEVFSVAELEEAVPSAG